MAKRLLTIAERRMDAPADLVYMRLANYRDRTQILPSAASGYAVEEGGMGDGTVLRVTITLAGQAQSFRMRVDEPEPGRVLREREIDGSSITVFTVDPDEHGCHVRIESSWEAARGLTGLLDRLLGPRMFRRVLEEQLTLLDRETRT